MCPPQVSVSVGVALGGPLRILLSTVPDRLPENP
jgi:hypothetical protein